MSATHRLSHRLEYLGLSCMRACIRALPESAAHRFGAACCLLIQEGFGWRKAETTRRMQQVFPQKTLPELVALRRKSIRNLGHSLVELLRLESLDLKWAERFVELEPALTELKAAREPGKGVLLVIAHCGNWDLAGTLACAAGIPMCFIARKQKNPLTYGALVRARESQGGTVLDRDDPRLLQKVLKHLENNEVVAILVDIRARGEAGTFTFLGQPARIANGLGLLAAKSGAAVLTAALLRDGRRHHWHAFPVRQLTPATRSREHRDALLQACLDDLSRELLTHPEAYFWYNKKWVLDL